MSPKIALPSWVFSSSAASLQFLLLRLSVTAQFIWSAKPFSHGLYLPRAGSFSRETRGGSSVVVGDPYVHAFMLLGCVRYSIHSHAASWFSSCPVADPANITRLSPATVVAHPAGPAGIGATSHLPLMFGNDDFISPPNHAPASYIATLPVANATRPSDVALL